ncbi:MAG: hypothetical protein JWP25_2151 [Bradyrhizobium sp.]|nr:hypothetical protein [Bradyrhizobium sp.]
MHPYRLLREIGEGQIESDGADGPIEFTRIAKVGGGAVQTAFDNALLKCRSCTLEKLMDVSVADADRRSVQASPRPSSRSSIISAKTISRTSFWPVIATGESSSRASPTTYRSRFGGWSIGTLSSPTMVNA